MFKEAYPDIFDLILHMIQPNYSNRFTLTQVLQFPAIFQRMSVKNVINQIKDDLNDDKKQTKQKLVDTIINVTPFPHLAQTSIVS
jgi:serine/threonine protein kinase